MQPSPTGPAHPREARLGMGEKYRATGGGGDQAGGERSSMEATTGNSDNARETNLKHSEEVKGKSLQTALFTYPSDRERTWPSQ